jgi:hypothetical protein
MMDRQDSYPTDGAAAIFAGLLLVTLVVIGTFYILAVRQAPSEVIDIAVRHWVTR